MNSCILFFLEKYVIDCDLYDNVSVTYMIILYSTEHFIIVISTPFAIMILKEINKVLIWGEVNELLFKIILIIYNFSLVVIWLSMNVHRITILKWIINFVCNYLILSLSKFFNFLAMANYFGIVIYMNWWILIATITPGHKQDLN